MGLWLEHSGHSWKVLAARLAIPATALAYLGFSTLLRSPGGRARQPDIETFTMLLVPVFFGLGLAPLILLGLVRCRVCGLRMMGSSIARGMSRVARRRWIAALEACPVCGDDGRATPESRARWLVSGIPAEPPYWSGRRIALAILVASVVLGALMLLGELNRIRP
jgi:hypothetical protein